MTVRRFLGSMCGAAALAMAAAPAPAQQVAEQAYDLPAQPLGDALRAVAVASGTSIIAPAVLVAGKTAPALSGQFTPAVAVALLLRGSGLRARQVGGDLIVEQDSAEQDADASTSDILVTGSRIRGAAVASPVIGIDREQVRDAGQATLGDVVRAIPQSFGGGQNPGIGMNVPSGSGVDVGGGSSVNLRGLGSDASLTLLNGRRLAYTAVKQSVDVSAIPLSAIERIEVVPDGASAIYGSDAVAGVANILLRRDYEGVEASARVAASTEGGNVEQQYGALAGTRWSGGGALVAYQYGDNTAIRARDRSYAARRSPGLDLYPAMRQHSAIATAHQSLGSGLSFEIDGLYNIRWSDLTFPTTPTGDLHEGRATFSSVDKAFAIAPAFRLELAHDWQVTLSGNYGKDRVDYRQVECALDACRDSGPGFYRNTAQGFELSGSGKLFALPGGAAKLALGGGYRSIGFRRYSAANAAINTAHAQESYYGFGELSLPLIGPGEHVPFVHRIDASAALRYERYPGIDDVVTPKLGLIWSVSPDIDFKASWGKSFRTPTLYQQYQPRAVYLYPPAALGATGAPPGSGALLIVGGNPDLKPERATTWSATLALHPRALPGARLEISYFDVAYHDRIVAPITLGREALSNPIYRDQITLDPGAEDQAAVIAGAGTFLNLTGTPYDPAHVIAIVDNANVNAGRQTARGVDVLASYSASIASNQTLTVSANLAYLDSTQQLSPDQPVLPLAGVIFNPPHWRGRATAGWSGGPLTLTAAVNHVGGVRDVRFDPAVSIDRMTTFDLTARYRVEAITPVFDGLDLTLSVQNLFNDEPDPIAVSIPYDTPYDSTNYSPVGRLVAFQVRASW
ncbi:TonB-dependent receptor [Sphingomonas cannabina]|uniref:TonB-dependent receptor n=1 Tax=Sphingomonas cannabina TaxID=2899123 RepID=UPI001F19EDCA|nr:TonB-dependent receptor [Sphingomonas cannabina]UIJ46342.1 TonB-dependent receptor [Sphingomonas cannabina]